MAKTNNVTTNVTANVPLTLLAPLATLRKELVNEGEVSLQHSIFEEDEETDDESVVIFNGMTHNEIHEHIEEQEHAIVKNKRLMTLHQSFVDIYRNRCQLAQESINLHQKIIDTLDKEQNIIKELLQANDDTEVDSDSMMDELESYKMVANAEILTDDNTMDHEQQQYEVGKQLANVEQMKNPGKKRGPNPRRSGTGKPILRNITYAQNRLRKAKLAAANAAKQAETTKQATK